MTDHVSLGSVLNSGQPLRLGGKVGTEINKDKKVMRDHKTALLSGSGPYL